jgi:hypothetical protein
MLAQGEKIDNFRRRFLGGGLTEEDKMREQEEIEKQRAHELKLVQMQTQQANRNALTNILSPEGNIALSDQQLPPPRPQQLPQAEALDEKAYEKEAIRQSQRKAEQMIENLAREKALAKKIAEENASKQKVRQRIKTKQTPIATQRNHVEGEADVKEAKERKAKEEKSKVKVKGKSEITK